MSTALIEDQALAISEPTFRPASLRKKPTRERLQVPFAEIADELFSQLRMISVQAIKSQNRSVFQDFRKSVIHSYAELRAALGNIISAKLDVAELPGLIEASFESMEQKCASEGKQYFADDAYQEILFSISTFRSAHRWIPQLCSITVPNDLHAQDKELARKFCNVAMWCQFHLDCLITALDAREPINQEVLQELLDELRTSVMAYAYVREALGLRNILSERYKDTLAVNWDAEDEALAAAE